MKNINMSFGPECSSQRCTKTCTCSVRAPSKLVIRPMPDYSDKWTLKMPVRERRAFFRPFAYASSSTSNAHTNRIRQDARRSGADFPPCCGIEKIPWGRQRPLRRRCFVWICRGQERLGGRHLFVIFETGGAAGRAGFYELFLWLEEQSYR